MSRRFLPDGGSVVCKEPLGPDRQLRIRRERAILKQVAGVPGVVQLAAGALCPDGLALVDLVGDPLPELRLPLPVAEVIQLGAALAGSLAELHRRGILHNDITPANIVLTRAGTAPTLVDFASATTAAELRPEFRHRSELPSALPYTAPEQTGRTARPVDQRADLYALGATLYELATGAPPFASEDPARLSHDQLTRVPTAPAVREPAVPAMLSDIIMRLLEKEPDNRYQSADGLRHDLARLRQSPADSPRFPLGQLDQPIRLLPPSRLVGRDGEIAALGAAFAGALSGRSRVVLVSGASGVGKSALIEELRPMVAAAGGWFVAGKFDEYRHDEQNDAARHAFVSLARLLLAEPEVDLSEVRTRLLAVLGDNAGLLAAAVPEFARVLQIAPATTVGDPLTVHARLQRIGVDVLRAVASPKHPIVFVIDDLQWAPRVSLGFIDLVIAEGGLDGVLLVGAYRDDVVDAAHPLAALRDQWRRHHASWQHLQLENLPEGSLASLLADVLRLDEPHAGELAMAIAPHTRGNPCDTVELLNSLRDHRVLQLQGRGWRWDPESLARRLSDADVTGLLAERVRRLPPPSQEVLYLMACLGGRVEHPVLRAATGLTSGELDQRLQPVLADRLLIREPGAQEAVRFRHDRIRDAVLSRVVPGEPEALRLQMARRLRRHPELFAVAAQQYLPVYALVTQSAERAALADLFRRAADHAKLSSNHAAVASYLAVATTLLDPTDHEALLDVHTSRHAALYSLGRLDEADDLFRTIEQLSPEPFAAGPATLVQISSLTNRGRASEGITLGLTQLRRLGYPVPDREQLPQRIGHGLELLYEWIESGTETDNRPDLTDPVLLASAAIFNQLMAAAIYADQPLVPWLVLAAVEIWVRHGPGRPLAGPAVAAALVTVALRADYRTGHRAARRILAVCEARQYEPETSRARLLYAWASGHWFESLEQDVARVKLAREELIRSGNLESACQTFYVSAYMSVDCAPTLDEAAEEVEAALDFARRTGNGPATVSFESLQRCLTGLTSGAVAPEPELSLLVHPQFSSVLPVLPINRALAATLLDEPPEPVAGPEAVTPPLPATTVHYPTVWAYLLRGLALAQHARIAARPAREALLAELDTVIDWMGARAVDAPVNFGHLARLLAAERAWTQRDFLGAAHAFDAARREVAGRSRPWHHALILERAGRFYLSYGNQQAGAQLLTEARRAYAAWGASAKVAQLGWAYPLPGAEVEGADLRGILTTSQAISSETTIGGLQERVGEVLSELAGATGVWLAIRDRDADDWSLPAPDAADDAMVPLAEAEHRGLLPASAVRYVERTGEVLIVTDATRDQRFARDPYLTGLERCSLLVIPVVNRDSLRALLLLENRLIGGAFTAGRLGAVRLIASQLAVSLDNAMVYSSLERKVIARTEDLARANAKLAQLSTTDALTGLPNRRRLEELLRTHWRRSRHSGEPISFAMIDIDHFKRYNDHFGHLAGDHCLQRVAELLRTSIREHDQIARYGGEEFAVLMPGTDLTAARLAAEHLRAAVAAAAELHALAAAGIVTVSIGVASTVAGAGSRMERLVEAADVNLYHAKRGGRNRLGPAGIDQPPR